jgi:hypothetical protein
MVCLHVHSVYSSNKLLYIPVMCPNCPVKFCPLRPEASTAAVLYSPTNTEAGLRAESAGNNLFYNLGLSLTFIRRIFTG